MELERAVLGDEFVEGEPVWSYRAEHPEPRANVWRILAEAGAGGGAALRAGCAAAFRRASRIWRSTKTRRCICSISAAIRNSTRRDSGSEQANPGAWRFYNEFLADWRRFFAIDGVGFPTARDPRHTFAWFRQIQRAFEITFRDIIGSSLPAARLRGAVWQSIFTHDMRRYRRTLYARMGEFATLITGPSGTGKELAARAIAESRYVPFDDRRLAFRGRWRRRVFLPINISALSPTLVESELFGHRRGAFTGAMADRQRLARNVPRAGVGISGRAGRYRPGDTGEAAARDRDADVSSGGRDGGAAVSGQADRGDESRSGAGRCARGSFREDLYYRLCSDQVATPSLAEQLAVSPAGAARAGVLHGAARGGRGRRRAGGRSDCRGSRRIWGRSMRGRGTIASWSSA